MERGGYRVGIGVYMREKLVEHSKLAGADFKDTTPKPKYTNRVLAV